MAFGVTMGFFITYLKVQPFIATLAGLWVARGLCFFISDDAIPIRNRLYEVLAGTKLLIPGLSDPVDQAGRVRLDHGRRRAGLPARGDLRRALHGLRPHGLRDRRQRAVRAADGPAGQPDQDARLHAQRAVLGAGRDRAQHRCRVGPRPVRDGHGADRHRRRGHRRDAADRRRRLRVRDAVRRPDHRRHPDPHPVQRAAQLVVDADRRRRADARLHRRPELPRHATGGRGRSTAAAGARRPAPAADAGAQDGSA